MTIKKAAAKEAYAELWRGIPDVTKERMLREARRKGTRLINAIEAAWLKLRLNELGVVDWADEIDKSLEYEENVDIITKKYGMPENGAEIEHKRTEEEVQYKGYMLENLKKAVEAEKVGETLPFEYATVDAFVEDIRRDMILNDREIREITEPMPFKFEELKRSLDIVTGDITELKKTVRGFEDKFVTKDNLKQELAGMESRMTERITEKVTESVTEKVSEKVSEITTRQIREELQRLREEYAKLPPEIIPPREIPEEVSRAYLRELRAVETWVRSVVELKNYLVKFKSSPPFDMSESERLKMIETIVDKLIVLIPETEEGISNIEKVQSDLTDFNISDALKNRLIERLDTAELARYAIVI